MTRHLGIVLVSLLVGYDAHALNFVGQTRLVEAEADVSIDGLEDDSDTDSGMAAGTGPYMDSVMASASSSFGDFGDGTADQDTTLMVMPGSIWGDGVGGAGASFDILDPGFPDSFASGFGGSVYEITFTVTSPTPFFLAYALLAGLDALGGTGDLAPAAFWLLAGDVQGIIDGDIAEDLLADGNDVMADDSFGGVLPPDTYSFAIGAVADGIGFEDGFGSGVAVYAFELHVPEPGVGTLLGLGLVGLAASRTPRRARRVARATTSGRRTSACPGSSSPATA